MGVLGADTRKMNKSGVKNGGGFPGIRNLFVGSHCVSVGLTGYYNCQKL